MAMPRRGEVWNVRFDPAVGAEIQKVRPAVVLSTDSVGRLPLKIVVPITDWKPAYAQFAWFVRLPATADSGLTKDSGADAFQVKSLAEARFLGKLGELDASQLDDICRQPMARNKVRAGHEPRDCRGDRRGWDYLIIGERYARRTLQLLIRDQRGKIAQSEFSPQQAPQRHRVPKRRRNPTGRQSLPGSPRVALTASRAATG